MSNSKTIKAPPNENEMMVLGAMINNDKNAKIGLKLVHEDHFEDKRHKVIFKAIGSTLLEKGAIEVGLLQNTLNASSDLEAAGGLSYLVSLPQRAGVSCHLEAYCKDLQDATKERQLLALKNDFAKDLEQGAKADKIIAKLTAKLKEIEICNPHAESRFDYLLENNSEEKLLESLNHISPGVSTGFSIGNIDIVLPGGAVSVVALPTSHGKTATMINYSLGVLNHHHDKSVYFFTYEEDACWIQMYFLNTYSNKILSKNNRNSIVSYFSKGETAHIKKDMRATFLNDKKAFFTHLIDTGRLKVFYSEMSVEELIAAIEFIKKNTNVGLVCIDYMQLLSLLRNSPGSRQEELKAICLMLKDCAIKTGLPILIGAQFNRQVVAEADLSPIYISEAGDIERIANLIIGGWNRTFAGFSREGNRPKNSRTAIPPEDAIYFEVLKGRGIGNGHNSVMDFNGNTGKISNKINSNTSMDTKPMTEKYYDNREIESTVNLNNESVIPRRY